MERKKVQCDVCGKNISSANIIKHKKTKHCLKHSNDKTAGRSNSPVLTVSGVTPKTKTSPEIVPAEISKSKILTEININGEFETMSDKFNGSKKDEDKEKKYKYKCECGEYFNIPAEGNHCPFCGV